MHDLREAKEAEKARRIGKERKWKEERIECFVQLVCRSAPIRLACMRECGRSRDKRRFFFTFQNLCPGCSLFVKKGGAGVEGANIEWKGKKRTPEASKSPPGLKRTTLTVLLCAVRVSTCFTSGLPSASSLTSHSCRQQNRDGVSKRGGKLPVPTKDAHIFFKKERRGR